jgi:hypothetical protein
MTDIDLMEADCVHGKVWYECKECDKAMLNDQEQALLGLAPTEDLMRELIARFRVNGMVTDNEYDMALNTNRARVLTYILYGLSSDEKRYRTVDSY